MLILTSALLHQMYRHAEQTYPDECCGILLGQLVSSQTDPEKRLQAVWPTRNAWSETVALELQSLPDLPAARYGSRRDRYWIDPGDLLQAQKTARTQNQQIIGIYHSHPDHAAVPSECDRRLAWTTYAYVILSVQQGKTAEALCWQLNQSGQFEPEPLRLE